MDMKPHICGVFVEKVVYSNNIRSALRYVSGPPTDSPRSEHGGLIHKR